MLSEFDLSPPAKESKNEDKDLWEGTTWLQAVPFVDIDKHEEAEILEFLTEHIKLEYEGSSKERIESVSKFYKLNGVDPGHGSIRVGPVVQLHSFIISNQFDAEIFGQISVPDDKNHIFYIYKRDEDEPERVRTQLSLNGCIVTPVTGGNVNVTLTNKDTGRQLFEGGLDVEKSSTKDDQGKCTLVFDGQDGYRASMVFTKNLFAAIAKIEMYLFDKTCSVKGTSYRVYGTIRVNDIVCFQKKSEEAVEMVYGEYNGFPQSRCVFAVPVFTPPVVKIELFMGEHEVIADDKIELDCHWDSDWSMPFPYTSSRNCKDQKFKFGMDVQWICHDEYFYGSWFGRWEDDLKVQWSSLAGQVTSPCITVTSDHLVEVFSVCIAGDSSVPLALCGTIVVQDGGGMVYIFSRYKNLPDKLSVDEQMLRPVSLAWPVDRWVRLEDFCMYVKLRDKSGNQVCRGSISWRQDFNTRYDVRMCDVIQGENGYFAAVHYSVFKNASRAKVSIKWEGQASCLVYGSIIAQYKNYVYPSTYEKEYYQSIIFKRSEEDRVWVKKDSEIPLSKSHVSAPSDCEGLIVHVKLRCLPIRFHVGFFKPLEIVDEHLFEARSNATRRQLGCMSVNVEWFRRTP